MEIGTHRPRNVGWARAAALLYGDWGTSKAYVIGWPLSPLVFPLSDHPGVCALTGLVGYNYIIVCRHFRMARRLFLRARAKPGAGRARSLLLLADSL